MNSLELKDMVSKYINREISLDDLEKWLLPNLYQFVENPDSDTANLVAAIELCTAEYQLGERTEDDIRNYLRKALNENNVTFINFIDSPTPQIISGSSSNTDLYAFTETMDDTILVVPW